MARKPSSRSSALRSQQAVERALVRIYDVAYQRRVDLTPIDQASDLIRQAFGIRLVDCGRCGATLLFEQATMAPGCAEYRCRTCGSD